VQDGLNTIVNTRKRKLSEHHPDDDFDYVISIKKVRNAYSIRSQIGFDPCLGANPISIVVPADRLVGVELNPGPHTVSTAEEIENAGTYGTSNPNFLDKGVRYILDKVLNTSHATRRAALVKLRNFQAHRSDHSAKHVPAPQLVGIESNPGPDHELKGALKKRHPPTKAKKKEVILEVAPTPKNRAFPPALSKSKGLQMTRHQAPVTTSFNYTATPPKIFVNSDNKSTRYVHTEYIRDLTSNVVPNTFTTLGYFINPGNVNLFPWLSTQASSFSSYKFNSLRFGIDSIVGTGQNGMFCLASTPDPQDLLPNSKSSFLQLENAARANAWSHLQHVVPNDMLKRLPLYLTADQLGGTTTDSTRQIGQLFIGNQLDAASIVFGELYVTYDITLSHPQVPNPLTAFYTANSISHAAAATVTPSFDLSQVNTGNVPVTNFDNTGASFAYWNRVETGGKCLHIRLLGYMNSSSTCVFSTASLPYHAAGIFVDSSGGSLDSNVIMDDGLIGLGTYSPGVIQTVEFHIYVRNMPTPFFMNWGGTSMTTTGSSAFTITWQLVVSPILDRAELGAPPPLLKAKHDPEQPTTITTFGASKAPLPITTGYQLI
jgi:hypothetical protein